jgi:hypothetical protein
MCVSLVSVSLMSYFWDAQALMKEPANAKLSIAVGGCVLAVDLLTTAHEASERTAIPLQSNLIAANAFVEPQKEWHYVTKAGGQVGPVEMVKTRYRLELQMLGSWHDRVETSTRYSRVTVGTWKWCGSVNTGAGMSIVEYLHLFMVTAPGGSCGIVRRISVK